MSIPEKDKAILRDLAKKRAEIASLPIQEEKKELWRGLNCLDPVRPMILFEIYSLEGFLADYEPGCQDETMRNVERRFVYIIRQFEQLGDDIVFEPYFRLAWWDPELKATGLRYGDIEIVEHHAKQESMAYLSNFPIKDDLIEFQTCLQMPFQTMQTYATIPELPSLNGKKNTYYCGAYFGHALHGDAVDSAIDVARHLGADWN